MVCSRSLTPARLISITSRSAITIHNSAASTRGTSSSRSTAQSILASQNGRGSTGFSFRNPGDDGMFFDRITTDREARGLQDFVWIPRFENSFNLSDTQTVLAGVSGAFGSNETGADSRTQIYGGDLLYKWKSSHAEGGFPFVKWQNEFMYRRFEAGRGIDRSFPVAETFHDWGLYSQVLWGFKKGWVAGIRGD